MRELALFAGGGGGLLGSHLLGWDTRCAVEIEPYHRSILLARQRDGFLPRFPSGMTSEPSTGARGETRSTSLAEDSLASHLAPLHMEKTMPLIYGQKCGELSAKYNPDGYLPKTSKHTPYKKPEMISVLWVTKSVLPQFQRQTWVQTILGADAGWLATPTCTGNQAAPSMQKHCGCRNFVAVFGEVSPLAYEWMMGWPIGWTALEPLATDKFQQWLRSHGGFCPKDGLDTEEDRG